MAQNPMRKLLPTEVDLVKERGSALILTADRLQRSLGELDAVAGRLSRATDRERPRLEAEHAQARHHAAHQLWLLIVQREAVGLSNHQDVYEVYGIPRSLLPSSRPPAS